jgi:hypothetical protein
VSLGNVANIGNIVWRGFRGGAAHDDVEHAVCADSFFGNGTGIGLGICTKDETGQNYEISQNSLQTRDAWAY